MITVIIPTRNRAKLLSGALESLGRQTLDSQKYEILVIDNGSLDQTHEVVERYVSKLPNLRYIFEPSLGLHAGRHAGMKAAKGQILVFTDDDIEAFPTWLASVKEAFVDPGVAMVGGNNYPMFLDHPPTWLSKLWNRQTLRGYKAIPSLSVIEFTGQPKIISPHLIWGCNFVIRKDILLAAGGFHPDGMPKEMIRFRGDGETHVSRYVAESGMKCLFHKGASVYHKVTPERMTFGYFQQRGFNQGVSDSFTQLRQQGASLKKGRVSFFRRGLGFAVRKAISLLDTRDVKQATSQLEQGYREGFAYHQSVYRNDPEVREWVHSPTYY